MDLGRVDAFRRYEERSLRYRLAVAREAIASEQPGQGSGLHVEGSPRFEAVGSGRQQRGQFAREERIGPVAEAEQDPFDRPILGGKKRHPPGFRQEVGRFGEGPVPRAELRFEAAPLVAPEAADRQGGGIVGAEMGQDGFSGALRGAAG